MKRTLPPDGQRSHATARVLGASASGAPAIAPGTPEWGTFTAALDAVCLSLAKQIARDGEGATKFVEVHVRGAATQRDALLAAKTIANSPLVKTAWFGGDPNWGRIISAVGDSAVAMDPLAVQIFFDRLAVYDRGRIADEVQLKALEEICSHKSFSVTVDLHVGEAAETVYTCDLSYEYVKINGEYTT